MKRELICVSEVVYLFIWGVMPSFPFAVTVAASQKTRFRHSKNRKRTFHGTKQKSDYVGSLPSQGPRVCLIWSRSKKL
jgi:hypothetical protein